MSHELELAAADSAGGFLHWRRKKKEEADPAEPSGPCANCATPLLGPWCHQCGQLAEDFHRSTWRLLGEAVEGLFHFDGRLWRTLPHLFLRPDRLTRDFLDGHRAPQVPPLRLFLVVLLLVFTCGSIGGAGSAVTIVMDDNGKVIGKTERLDQLTPQQRALAKASIMKVKVATGSNAGADLGGWVQGRLLRVLDDPDKFMLVLEKWSERFAFLMLPLAAGLLGLLFVFQRRFYFYDHIIFSLHSLSASGVLLSVVLVTNLITDQLAGLLLLAAPVHLFVHMRGVYQTSVLGTLARMALLFVFSSLGYALLMLGLVVVGLSGM